jgi:hypothetical protein
VATAALRRGRSANAARLVAKERRQKIVLAALAVLLVALLAYELPHMLGRSASSNSSSASAVAPPSTGGAVRHAPKALRGARAGADPFAVKSLPTADARAAAAGGPDPFTAPAPPAPPPPPASTPVPPAAVPVSKPAPKPLPQQIVIGRPGGHRVATHGWIVILASIPVGNGRSEAARFARAARGNVGPLSILNSSQRRPLRGGYWVVYSGPYATLHVVGRHAGDIHASGYRTAYIRELIAYR